jgi:hypothetical protein
MTRRGRIASVAAAAIAAVAVAAPAGLAATPQKINSDLADGRLDGTYSQKDLSNYLKSATAQGYGGPVQQASPPSGVLGDATLAADRGSRGETLAFTGLDLALLTVGGFLLLALGAVLRWVSREKAWRKH